MFSKQCLKFFIKLNKKDAFIKKITSLSKLAFIDKIV